MSIYTGPVMKDATYTLPNTSVSQELRDASNPTDAEVQHGLDMIQQYANQAYDAAVGRAANNPAQMTPLPSDAYIRGGIGEAEQYANQAMPPSEAPAPRIHGDRDPNTFDLFSDEDMAATPWGESLTGHDARQGGQAPHATEESMATQAVYNSYPAHGVEIKAPETVAEFVTLGGNIMNARLLDLADRNDSPRQ